MLRHLNAFRCLFSLFFTAMMMDAYAQGPEIGLELYSFRNQFAKDVPATLATIQRMGFRAIEGGGSYNLEPAAFRQLLKQHGLEMVSCAASFEELERDPGAVAERAKFYGARDVVCFWVPHQGDVFTKADADKGIEVFNNAGKVLLERGLRLAYHAHGYEFQPFEGGTFFDYMVKGMDPRYANFQMDVFWFHHSGQDPVQWLNKIPKRFLSLHLKDRQHGTANNQLGRADVETNVTLGAGDVDIKGIMSAAWKAGIRYYFIEDESSRSEVQVPQSVAYLKGLGLGDK